MDLEQLQELAEKDLKINDTELDLESLKTPQIHNKYLKHLTKFKLLLTRAQDDFTKVKRDKWEYYTGKADPAVYQLKPFNLKILKQDVNSVKQTHFLIQWLFVEPSGLKLGLGAVGGAARESGANGTSRHKLEAWFRCWPFQGRSSWALYGRRKNTSLLTGN